MERKEILTALNGIFSVVLNKENLQLDESMSTDDIDNWDSLTNMTIGCGEFILNCATLSA